MTIDALPTPPNRANPATFADLGDDFLGALPTFATQANALEANVDALEAAAAASAVAAAASAAASAASASAPIWVSGTTYAIGDVTWSPINAQSYRRITAGAGTTDPSIDGTNWTLIYAGNNSINRSARTSNTVLGTADRGTLIDITSGTFTQTFSAVATLTAGWHCIIRNSGTGDITLDPSGAELIDGLSSFIMYPGETRLVQCDGSELRSIVQTSFYRVFTSSGTFTRPPGYSRFQGLAWGAGGGGAAALGGCGGACSPFGLSAAEIGASPTVTIGAGGAAGAKGGDTTFIFVTQGGGPGNGYTQGGAAYGRSLTTPPYPGAYDVSSPSVNYTIPNAAHYGGGVDVSAQQFLANSVYGGGCGHATTAGTSIFGGAGGVGAAAGTAPAGGGGPTAAGARGELRIWGIL